MKARSRITMVMAMLLVVILIPVVAAKTTRAYAPETSYASLRENDYATPTPLPTQIPTGTPIIEANFPDARFREVLFTFDTNRNGYLAQDEMDAVTMIRCIKKGVTNLEGIQNFKNLKVLMVNDNEITNVNLQFNPNLEIVYLNNNKLTSLDVSHNAKLEVLVCFGNQLPSLDISRNSSLKTLQCQNNNIRYLSLSKNANLNFLRAEGNDFAFLDASKLPSIKTAVEKDKKSIAGNTISYNYSEGNKNFTLSVDDDVIVSLDGKGSPVPPMAKPVTDEKAFGTFIERLYVVALERESDPEGKAFWINHVMNEGASGADCARYFLLTAPEFMNRKLSNDAFIDTLYKIFFDRESDEEGKSFWMESLKKGTKRKDVVNNFIDSNEWCNICAMYGVRSGAATHKSQIASKNAEAFASRLYTCCLGRAPEDQGLEYWSVALTNQDRSGYEAAKLFFESEEFRNYRFSDAEYLRRLYTTFMGRQPESKGFSFWMGQMVNGTSREDVLRSFAESDEFSQICQSYGINRGV